jgi:hypothetical protein
MNIYLKLKKLLGFRDLHVVISGMQQSHHSITISLLFLRIQANYLLFLRYILVVFLLQLK